jgi:hypothetical protein
MARRSSSVAINAQPDPNRSGDEFLCQGKTLSRPQRRRRTQRQLILSGRGGLLRARFGTAVLAISEGGTWKEKPIRTKRVGVTRCESPAAFAQKRVGTLGACAPGRQSQFPSRFLRRGAALVPAPAWRPPA